MCDVQRLSPGGWRPGRLYPGTGNGKCPSRAAVSSCCQAEQAIDETQQERADVALITKPASFRITYGSIYTYQTVIYVQTLFWIRVNLITLICRTPAIGMKSCYGHCQNGSFSVIKPNEGLCMSSPLYSMFSCSNTDDTKNWLNSIRTPFYIKVLRLRKVLYQTLIRRHVRCWTSTSRSVNDSSDADRHIQ